MGSSPGFVSNPCDFRPIKTRFRSGFDCHCLNLATEINSQAHSPRGTPSGLLARTRVSAQHRPSIALRLLVSLRFQVLFHSPQRGTFHLSLTVLVHYRSPDVFSLGEWNSPASCRISVPGSTQVPNGRQRAFAYGALTLFGRLSHTFPLALCFVTPIRRALQPRSVSSAVWAAPFSLATTQGMLSFPLGTEMFQFPRFPPACLCVQQAVQVVRTCGFPHSDILGSTPVHGSPGLFAVTHVLLRHLAPRHPP